MPPIRRKAKPARKRRKLVVKGTYKRKTALNVFPKSISSARGRALINVNNRTPKTMSVLLSYKQMIRITANQQNLAQNPLASGFPFRISLNSPMAAQGEILHLHTNQTVGTKTSALTTTPNNLAGALAETGLPDKYNWFYVKKSIVDVVVMGQINQDGLREGFSNEPMTQTDNSQSTYLAVADKSLTGELYSCAHCTEDNSFNLNPITVNSIRNDISGSVVKESLIFPDSRGRSNRFRYIYTPKKRFDMTDIKDNLGKLRFEKDGPITSGFESHLNMCVGKQLFPSTQALDSALQTIDIRVQYEICAYERKSDVGSNQAVPVAHTGEL